MIRIRTFNPPKRRLCDYYYDNIPNVYKTNKHTKVCVEANIPDVYVSTITVIFLYTLTFFQSSRSMEEYAVARDWDQSRTVLFTNE